MNFYVYEHWRLDRDECFYVGKGRGRRAYEMKQSRNRHHLAIQAKVSREGFAIEVRIVACGISEEDAFAIECERIRFWRYAGVDLANLTDGGEGSSGRVLSDDAKARIGLAASQRRPSEETRAKMGAARKGKKRSPEMVEKMRAALTGRPKSEAHKAKIKEARAKQVCTDATRAKMSATRTGRPAWNKGIKMGPRVKSIS